MATTEKSGIARRLVRALVEFYYPRIEVTGAELIPRTGPVLLVANHPNSLIDPVLLGLAAQRPVKLMAKAPLFDVPLFGGVLRALGMVPAYRGSDDSKQVAKNLESLSTAARQIAAGDVMGIFPEGKSHDAVQLALVRSGAARLAMQAVGLGARGLKVIPVGINYERKERFRTAVWLKVGRPIDAENWLRMHAGDEHRAMRTLTQEIIVRLQRCITHLDDAAWETLLDDVEALLPPAPARRGWSGKTRAGVALGTLHRRKRAADAINYFQRADPARAQAAAARVGEHARALEAEGVPPDAMIFLRRGPPLFGALLGDALRMALGFFVGVLGLLHHAIPYGIVRLLSARIARDGRMIVALSRLGLSVPIYAGWYAFVWWRMNLYFLPWVAWAWMGAMPVAGLVAIASARHLRRAAPFWWAQLRLLVRRARAAELREEHAALGRLIAAFADEAKLPTAIARPTSRIYRPPVWLTVALSACVLTIVVGLGAWLLRDRPIDVVRQAGPALHEMAPASFAERMDADERAMSSLIDGLQELEVRFRGFEAGLQSGARSYYRPEDDDEIRRMLVSYLTFRTALLRTVWFYQRQGELDRGKPQLRALLLHYTAAAVAYDYAARFVLAFDGAPIAIRKLNEAEPRWDLPAGTYDSIRANLGHVAHRRWLEAGWRNYHATLPEWTAADLCEAEPYASFHRAIATAGENTTRLSEKLVRYKFQTAIADVGKFTRSGWYRTSSAVSTLIGDAKIREPRRGQSLITPERFNALRPRLRPGDIVIERHNWFLSNAFLPGFWPHAALYVGTMDELRALGLDRDPNVMKHAARFAQADAAGHPLAIVEAQSEGVIFTSAERSIGESDAVAVLRPRLTPEQTKEAIARAFSHVGKPYDFDFDFFSADKLVCTEVVYRAYGGHLDLPLVEVLGRKTLPAVEIVRHWSSPAGAAQLEFIAFLDGDEASGKCTERDATALVESIGRPALTWLQAAR